MLFPSPTWPPDLPRDLLPTEQELLSIDSRWLLKEDPGTRLYGFPLGRKILDAPGSTEPHPPRARGFLKLYTYDNWFLSLRARLFESRAHREAQVLLELARRAIPCLELLAWGELDEGPWRRSSYLLTRYREGSTTLEARLHEEHSRPARRQILDEVAEAIRSMHSRGFVHGTLFPRNIMLPSSTTPATCPGLPAGFTGPCFFDAPWGRFHPGAASEDGRVTDLTCLFRFRDRSVSRGEIGRFLRIYLGRSCGEGWGETGRRLANRILRSSAFTRSYRRKLWFLKHRLFGGSTPVH